MLRVLLIDDHASYREALAFILERDPRFEVTVQAGSVAEARSKLSVVDVALVDLGLPDGSGVDVITELHAINPEGIVIVLTGSTDEIEYARAVEAGATGILSKSKPIREIINSVCRAADGALLLSPAEVIGLLRLASQHRQNDYAVRQKTESAHPP